MHFSEQRQRTVPETESAVVRDENSASVSAFQSEQRTLRGLTNEAPPTHQLHHYSCRYFPPVC